MIKYFIIESLLPHHLHKELYFLFVQIHFLDNRKNYLATILTILFLMTMIFTICLPSVWFCTFG